MPTQNFFMVRWKGPSWYSGVGGQSDGYSAVNVRFKMCQLGIAGPHSLKRMLEVYTPIQCSVPHCSDVTLTASAKDMYSSGNLKTQMRRFDSKLDYTPWESQEDIVLNKHGFNLICHDSFLSMAVGPNFSEGYRPFKIYLPIIGFVDMMAGKGKTNAGGSDE